MKMANKAELVTLSIERQALIEVLLQVIANTTDEQELRNVWLCLCIYDYNYYLQCLIATG